MYLIKGGFNKCIEKLIYHRKLIALKKSDNSIALMPTYGSHPFSAWPHPHSARSLIHSHIYLASKLWEVKGGVEEGDADSDEDHAQLVPEHVAQVTPEHASWKVTSSGLEKNHKSKSSTSVFSCGSESCN